MTTSLALQQGSPVDDVVLYGSPGAEITNASQLGVAPGHAYYEVARGDAVAIDIPRTGAFDAQIQDVPGMTPLSTAPAVSMDSSACVQHEGTYGHSEYPRSVNGVLRTSGYNMAAILAGNPDAVIGPPPTPETITTPRGFVAENPNYHS